MQWLRRRNCIQFKLFLLIHLFINYLRQRPRLLLQFIIKSLQLLRIQIQIIALFLYIIIIFVFIIIIFIILFQDINDTIDSTIILFIQNLLITFNFRVRSSLIPGSKNVFRRLQRRQMVSKRLNQRMILKLQCRQRQLILLSLQFAALLNLLNNITSLILNLLRILHQFLR